MNLAQKFFGLCFLSLFVMVTYLLITNVMYKRSRAVEWLPLEIQLTPDNYDLFAFDSVKKHCGVNESVFLGSMAMHGDCLRWLESTKDLSPVPHQQCPPGNTSELSLYHTLWFPHRRNNNSLPEMYKLSLMSIVATQGANAKVYLWIPEGETPSASNITATQIQKSLDSLVPRCKVSVFTFGQLQVSRMKNHFKELDFSFLLKRPHYVFQSDWIRMVTVFLYGGVWFDLDVIFLRNLEPLLQRQFVYRWSSTTGVNTAVMRFDQHSSHLQYLIQQQCCNGTGAHPNKLAPLWEKAIALKQILVYPSAFFDPLWIIHDSGDRFIVGNYSGVKLNSTHEFWENSCASIPCALDAFFPGVFTYHTHWHKGELVNHSLAAGFYRYFLG